LEEFKEFNFESSKKNSPEKITITPKDASRLLLKHIKDESESFLNDIITRAVITVPANFNPTQISAVKEAGEEAGFTEIRIQKEPVAVGIAYALEEAENKIILVYDFGGGTFDVSLLEIKNGVIDVLAVDGDKKLGGKDITEKVVEFIYSKLDDEFELDMFDEEKSRLSRSQYVENKRAIKAAAEEAKIELSEAELSTISIANLHKPEGLINFEMTITRKDFEREIAEIKKQSLDIVKRLISSNGIDKESINEIVMAGGTSLIPSIAKSITDTFGISPKNNIDSSSVISYGAAIMALKEWGKGDTIQVAPTYNDSSLLDFGVGVRDLRFDLLIKAGEELPYRIEKEYTTSKDNQETLDIEVYQRKSTFPNSGRTIDEGVDFIDRLAILGIPPRPVGSLTVIVTFELTKDDVLSVDVKVRENNIEIAARNISIKKASDAK
jgi:molecular chaperone DnaK